MGTSREPTMYEGLKFITFLQFYEGVPQTLKGWEPLSHSNVATDWFNSLIIEDMNNGWDL